MKVEENRITISPPVSLNETEIELPLSKSITNRLQILNFLSQGKLTIKKKDTHADDVILLSRNLEYISACSSSHIPLVVPTDNAGTVSRFLLAALAITPGTFLLTGSARMRQRPIKPLIDALQKLDADIKYTENSGSLPVLISGTRNLNRHCYLDTSQSSQFLSALVLIAPFVNKGLEIEVSDAEIFSNPYVQMSLKMISHYGSEYKIRHNSISISQGYDNSKNADELLEPDWSSASFWYEMITLSDKGKITLKGLKKNSLQGDSFLATAYESLGVKTKFTKQGVELHKINNKKNNITFKLEKYPDLALPLILSCAATETQSKFTGLINLKHKESDRFKAIINILDKLEVKYEYNKNDSIELFSGIKKSHKEFDSLNDHRIAMSLAPLSLCLKKITITNPNANSKSYPSYWKDLNKAGFRII